MEFQKNHEEWLIYRYEQLNQCISPQIPRLILWLPKEFIKIVNFDGPIMTDSGGYQVLEYGKVNVTPSIMAQFELDIGSDIPAPFKTSIYKNLIQSQLFGSNFYLL